jgi:menaquinone-dependent protoporphyrinogen IX oxidase
VWRVILASVFVAYDSKYGNTKRAAEAIAEGIRDVAGVEASVGNVKEVDVEDIAGYDALVLGAPNHMAKPSRTMMKFVDRLVRVDLKAKYVAVFGTYSGRVRDPDRAVSKMEKSLQKKLPRINLISASLSVRVHGVTGPIFEGELSGCRDFGRRIANQLKQISEGNRELPNLSNQGPRIRREKKTVDKMVHVYCKGNHKTKGNQLCAECSEFLAYAFLRLDKCPFQEEKSTCGKCLVHCYQPQMREKAKKVMRYSGPRLLLRAPGLALHHLFDGLKKPQTIKEFREKKSKEST